MTIDELHEITGRAIAEGDGHLHVLVLSQSKKGYDICRQAKFERIWLDMEKGINLAEPGVNVLLLTATAV